jgi:hypothetical protein
MFHIQPDREGDTLQHIDIFFSLGNSSQDTLEAIAKKKENNKSRVGYVCA